MGGFFESAGCKSVLESGYGNIILEKKCACKAAKGLTVKNIYDKVKI